MKRLFLFCLLAATALASSEYPRDGSWWRHLPDEQKMMWAVGWMDGAWSGQLLVSTIAGNPNQVTPYNVAINELSGIAAGQIVQGMDQFYAADFRNSEVFVADAAMMVAMIARAPVGSDTAKITEFLRERYKNAKIVSAPER